MADFIKGLELCEAFFRDVALPIINKYYPDLRYTAGLLGYGSDVLGYDDCVSADHMWGPRFYMFIDESDMHIREKLMESFENNLPYEYKGYSVNFSKHDVKDNDVRRSEFISSGKVSPLIWIYSVNEYIDEYLGLLPSDNLDWLVLSEHRLLGFTSGKLFVDMLDLSKVRAELTFYPYDVKLYLIASQWAMIGEEQAFVKRCADKGDEIGSRIICSRIIERLMRLCFLYKNQYAPYSKWFGTGFGELPVDDEIKMSFSEAINANTPEKREAYLVAAQMLVAGLHNESNITDDFEINPQSYYGRDIKVIFADRLADMVKEKITDEHLKNATFIGSLSQVGNFVALSDNPAIIRRIRNIYI